MKNAQIQIRCECPACGGKGIVEDEEFDESEPFPVSPYRQCEKCNGMKTITGWYTLDELANIFEE